MQHLPNLMQRFCYIMQCHVSKCGPHICHVSNCGPHICHVSICGPLPRHPGGPHTATSPWWDPKIPRQHLLKIKKYLMQRFSTANATPLLPNATLLPRQPMTRQQMWVPHLPRQQLWAPHLPRQQMTRQHSWTPLLPHQHF